MRVAVIGAGTAGPAAALLLARVGAEVTLFEAVAEPAAVGAGLLLQPTGMAVLARLGLLEAVLGRAAKVERLLGRTVEGRVVMDLAYADLRADLFGAGVHRGSLFTALFEALAPAGVTVRCGAPVSGLTERGGRLALEGPADEGDFELIIVADGARSQLREQVAPARRAERYGWGALWFIGRDDGRYGGVLSQDYRDTREMMGTLPSGRIRDGDSAELVSLFWSLPVAAIESTRAAGLAPWRERALALNPRVAPLIEQVEDMDQLLPAVYHDVVLPRPWRATERAGAVVIGDAAHAMSPQLGQGANLALVDAAALADALAPALASSPGALPAALADYARRRRTNLGFYQRASRLLTPLFQSDHAWLAWWRDRLMHPAASVPWIRRQMLASLAGAKTGVLTADELPKIE